MNNLNIPNLLSGLRLLISPPVGFILFKGHLWVAGVLYLLLILSDFLDGFIARKTQSQTPLGTILDPLADKVLIFSYIVPLWFGNFWWKPDGFLITLLLLKEFIVVVGSVFLLVTGKLPKPNLAGKLAVALLFLYGEILILCNLGVGIAIYLKPYLEGLVNGTLLLAVFLYLVNGVRAFLKIS